LHRALRALHPFPTRRSSDLLFGTGAALLFKGSGFYETDYRSESYTRAAKADQAPAPSADSSSTTGGAGGASGTGGASGAGGAPRSEEHTSELQSRGHLVCRL